MREYWLRIATAWLLLQFAARVMRSAENILRASTQISPPTETPDNIIPLTVEEPVNG